MKTRVTVWILQKAVSGSEINAQGVPLRTQQDVTGVELRQAGRLQLQGVPELEWLTRIVPVWVEIVGPLYLYLHPSLYGSLPQKDMTLLGGSL